MWYNAQKVVSHQEQPHVAGIETIMKYVKNAFFGGIGASMVSGVILSGVTPILVYGQGGYNLPGINTNTTVNTFITGVICVIAGYMFWILIALAVVFTIVAAYKYLFSGGESSKVSEATKSITFAAASVAVALLAKAFPLIVASIVLGPSGLPNTGGNICP